MAKKQSKLQRDIRKLIRTGNLEKVFERLRPARSLSEHRDTIILWELRYKQQKEQRACGIIAGEEFDLFKLSLSKDILKIIDRNSTD